MKIVKGKIVEVTESELLDYYLARNLDDVMSFDTYKTACRENGTKLTEEKGGAE